METSRTTESVFSVTGRIISQLSQMRDSSSGKATLANLRNSIGKPFSETINIWPLVFEHLPEEFLSTNGKMTAEETAILTSLQYYALHQQGLSESVHLSEKTNQWENIGESLRVLRQGTSASIDQRFNAMVTATSYEELTHHLRQLIALLKSKEKSQTRINYAKLADDLYWFIRGYQENVRIRWARSYYRYNNSNQKGENNHVE